MRGGFNDLSKLLLDEGAKVWHEGKVRNLKTSKCGRAPATLICPLPSAVMSSTGMPITIQLYLMCSRESAHYATGGVVQFVSMADSPLSGAVRNIPDKPFELAPDWEVEPESLEIMEKIGACGRKFRSPDLPNGLEF